MEIKKIGVVINKKKVNSQNFVVSDLMALSMYNLIDFDPNVIEIWRPRKVDRSNRKFKKGDYFIKYKAVNASFYNKKEYISKIRGDNTSIHKPEFLFINIDNMKIEDTLKKEAIRRLKKCCSVSLLHKIKSDFKNNNMNVSQSSQSFLNLKRRRLFIERVAKLISSIDKVVIRGGFAIEKQLKAMNDDINRKTNDLDIDVLKDQSVLKGFTTILNKNFNIKGYMNNDVSHFLSNDFYKSNIKSFNIVVEDRNNKNTSVKLDLNFKKSKSQIEKLEEKFGQYWIITNEGYKIMKTKYLMVDKLISASNNYKRSGDFQRFWKDILDVLLLFKSINCKLDDQFMDWLHMTCKNINFNIDKLLFHTIDLDNIKTYVLENERKLMNAIFTYNQNIKIEEIVSLLSAFNSEYKKQP